MNGYKDIINKLPDDSKLIINKSIEIYNVIKRKEIKIDIFNNGKISKKRLTYEDKANMSIFWACLVIDSYIKNLFNKYNVNEDMVISFLNLSYDIKMGVHELENSVYEKYFNLDFANIIRFLIPDDMNYNLIVPERIMYEQRWNRVVERMFKKNNLLSNGSLASNQMFEEIKDILFDKEIEIKELSSDTDAVSNDNNNVGFSIPKIMYNNNPSVGRRKEIEYILISLIKGKSIVLVGENGVGKDSVVNGIEYLIKNKKINCSLKNINIREETIISLISGCPNKIILEEKIQKLINDLVNDPNVILYIKDLYELIESNFGNGKVLEIVSMLKPYLDCGKIRLITCMTCDEFERYNGNIITSNMEVINISEPDKDMLYLILIDKIGIYCNKYNIKFSFDEEDTKNIVDNLIYLTDIKNRKYDKGVGNPKIVLSLLEDVFAYACYEGVKDISINHIINAILKYNNVYESVKNNVMNNIKNI